jgi:hypothetical protein
VEILPPPVEVEEPLVAARGEHVAADEAALPARVHRKRHRRSRWRRLLDDRAVLYVVVVLVVAVMVLVMLRWFDLRGIRSWRRLG